MKIEYQGHACFLITTSSGVRIVTDPFDPTAYGESLAFETFSGEAEIVTTSHAHPDHNASEIVGGRPVVFKSSGAHEHLGVHIRGIETFHDETRGSQRGKNIVFVFEADGLRAAHMGDLGHVLTPVQQSEIGAVDVVMLPVGGYYTITALHAHMVAAQVHARIVIPMHYRNDKCGFPIARVAEFVDGRKDVIVKGGTSIDISPERLPAQPQIVVLDHAL